MKFEQTETMNWEGALRGMRFAMKSEDKIDSELGIYHIGPGTKISAIPHNIISFPSCTIAHYFDIGPNDMQLAQNLVKAGFNDNAAHCKFLRQILVSVDITAPLYWWSEFDTYKVGTTANSESTMHRILKDNLTADDFTYEYESKAVINYVIEKINDIKNNASLTEVQKLRRVKQMLPTSYNQKRHITMNYEVIRNIIKQRQKHRLLEWSTDFIKWTKTLPYAEEFLYNKTEEDTEDTCIKPPILILTHETNQRAFEIELQLFEFKENQPAKRLYFDKYKANSIPKKLYKELANYVDSIYIKTGIKELITDTFTSSLISCYPYTSIKSEQQDKGYIKQLINEGVM